MMGRRLVCKVKWLFSVLEEMRGLSKEGNVTIVYKMKQDMKHSMKQTVKQGNSGTEFDSPYRGGAQSWTW